VGYYLRIGKSGLCRFSQILPISQCSLVNFKLYILWQNFEVVVAFFFSCNQLISIPFLFVTAIIFANSELCKFS